MAQTEDTELRDLVIEALEKNGSLAKIRALLRANIFLAFEDDYENIKQNITLDNVLKLPEGILSLSIVYEFLEFCNLKNTLFVYKSETRQDKEYKYEGQPLLLDKLGIKREGNKEPVLVSMLKNMLRPNQRHYLEKSNVCSHMKSDNNELNKDDQNCTYIVHEDSSCTSNSHSDNSSDEKTKLHLRLPLDNSDTDTSSDSTRDKSSSEYIPNEHIIQQAEDTSSTKQTSNIVKAENHKNLTVHSNKEMPYFLTELKIANNSSSDSTSYAELKPLNLTDEKLLNTTGIPTADNKTIHTSPTQSQNNILIEQGKNTNGHKTDSVSSTLNSISSISLKNNSPNKDSPVEKKSIERSTKSDTETAEYSYDFSISGASKNKDTGDAQVLSPQLVQENFPNDNDNKNSSNNSTHNNSQSSQSSVSISDVADLISEKSLSMGHGNNDNESVYNKSKVSKSQSSNKSSGNIKSQNNDSGDFSESPVPSLSNLSLDIHSD